jgi:hypothetical protein
MAYARVNWVDNVTPLDQAHLNQMDAYIATLDTSKADASAVTAGDALKVDKDSVVVAATRIVASKLLAGDAQPAFQIIGDGKHQWGAGGANLVDTNLYRSATATLKTDQDFRSAGSITALDGNASFQIALTSLGVRFGNPADTNLYRSAAGQLKTDGMILTGNSVISCYGGVGEVFLSYGGPAVAATIAFGTNRDTNLYRQAASALRTDGEMWIGARMKLRQFAEIQFGPGDGTTWDTNLYRSAAGTLRTDSLFICYLPGIGARQLEVGAADSGGAGYRMVRVAN